MDGYPMPVADVLIDAAAGHRLLVSWMVMLGIIRYLWLKKIFPKWPLGVLGTSACLSGSS